MVALLPESASYPALHLTHPSLRLEERACLGHQAHSTSRRWGGRGRGRRDKINRYHHGARIMEKAAQT